MDHESFDRFARVLAAAGTRRSALAAFLGVGVAGAYSVAGAKKNGKTKKRKARSVSTQAVDCLSLGHGSNVSGCNYSGQDHSGEDLSSSTMIGTIFNNADLIRTNFSSSNLRGARFRGANLCGADLSSSQLRNADMRGFASPNRATNLTLADLSSSGCAGLQTNPRTIICFTTWCDGTVRSLNCPSGVTGTNVCCADAECPTLVNPATSGPVAQVCFANHCCVASGVVIGASAGPTLPDSVCCSGNSNPNGPVRQCI
jgi:hypothetical protein